VVAQAVDPRRNLFHLVALVGAEEELCHVSHDETERSILRAFGMNLLKVRPSLDARSQEICDELPARAGRIAIGRAGPIVGHGRDSSRAREREPAAPFLEVASAENRGRVVPECRRRAGALVRLVAVPRKDEQVVGVGAPGEEHQAHCRLTVTSDGSQEARAYGCSKHSMWRGVPGSSTSPILR